MTQQYDNWFMDADELGTETALGDRDSAEVGRALQLVAEFAKRRTASAWPHQQPGYLEQVLSSYFGFVAGRY